MEDLTLISCSYNTPEITLTMLKSWVNVHNSTQRGLICDNSTNDITSTLLKEVNVPFFKRQGGTHGNGVNELIERCNTKYALLVDTDVVFLRDHSNIFERFKEQDLTIMGKVEGDRGGKSIYNRVNPWHCFINVDHIKERKIKFFDEDRMRKSFNTNKIYDIGSTFFEDIRNNKLKIGDIDLSSYYSHLEGMSWYKNKYKGNTEDTGIDFGGTHNNYGYVALYEKKYAAFYEVANRYKDTVITNSYI